MTTNLKGVLGLCITAACKEGTNHSDCNLPSTPCVCECHGDMRVVAMCELCFGVFRADQLYRDSGGALWDICSECGVSEDLQSHSQVDTMFI